MQSMHVNLRNALLFEFGICCTGSIVGHLCIIDIRVSDEVNEKLKMSILEVDLSMQIQFL